MTSTSIPLPTDLAAARRRFEKWRAGGRPKRPLPREMWEMAADLVAIHGVYRVSRALRLEYYKVKKQAEVRQAKKRTRKRTKQPAACWPEFVEVASGPASMLVTSGCTIELTDEKNGRQMTIRSSGGMDAATLVATFCGRVP